MSNLPIIHRISGGIGALEQGAYNNRYFITTQRMLNISNGLVNMIE